MSSNDEVAAARESLRARRKSYVDPDQRERLNATLASTLETLAIGIRAGTVEVIAMSCATEVVPDPNGEKRPGDSVMGLRLFAKRGTI